MTPKEKARQLIERFNHFDEYYYDESFKDTDLGKQCALIAVDEILEITKTNWATQYQKNGETIIKKGITYKKYWVEVKKEIEAL